MSEIKETKDAVADIDFVDSRQYCENNITQHDKILSIEGHHCLFDKYLCPNFGNATTKALNAFERLLESENKLKLYFTKSKETLDEFKIKFRFGKEKCDTTPEGKTWWPCVKELYIRLEIKLSDLDKVRGNIHDTNVFDLLDKLTEHRKDYVDDFLTKNPELLIPSGYKHNNTGHAVALYYKHNPSDNKYDIYLFNSGNGLKYHGTQIKNKHRGVLKFSGLDKSCVRKLITGAVFIKNCLYTTVDILYTFIQKTIPIDKYISAITNELNTNSVYDSVALLEPQFSGSCTYFSFYYFMKFMYFTINVTDSFDNKTLGDKFSVFYTNAFEMKFAKYMFENLASEAKKNCVHDYHVNYLDIFKRLQNHDTILHGTDDEKTRSDILASYSKNVKNWCCLSNKIDSRSDFTHTTNINPPAKLTFISLATDDTTLCLINICRLLIVNMDCINIDTFDNSRNSDIFYVNMIFSYIVNALVSLINKHTTQKNVEKFNTIDLINDVFDINMRLIPFEISSGKIEQLNKHTSNYPLECILKIKMLLCLLLCILNEELHFFHAPAKRSLTEYETNLIHKILDNNIYTSSSISYNNSVALFEKYYDLLFLEYAVNGDDIVCHSPNNESGPINFQLFLIFDNVFKKNIRHNRVSKNNNTQTITVSFAFCHFYVNYYVDNVKKHRDYNAMFADYKSHGYIKRLDGESIIMQYNISHSDKIAKILRCDKQELDLTITTPEYSPIKYFIGDAMLRMTIDAINNKKLGSINKMATKMSYTYHNAYNIDHIYRRDAKFKKCGYAGKNENDDNDDDDVSQLSVMLRTSEYIVKNTFVNTNDYKHDNTRVSPYDNVSSYDDSDTIANTIIIDNLLDRYINDDVFFYILYVIAFFNVPYTKEYFEEKLGTIIKNKKNKNKNTSCEEMLKIIIAKTIDRQTIINFINIYKSASDYEQPNYPIVENLRALFTRQIIMQNKTEGVFDLYSTIALGEHMEKALNVLRKNINDVRFDTIHDQYIDISYDDVKKRILLLDSDCVLSKNFVFISNDAGYHNYVGTSINKNLNLSLKLELTADHRITDQKYTVKTVVESKVVPFKYSYCTIKRLFDEYNIDNFVIIDGVRSHTLYFPRILSQKGNVLYLSHSRNDIKNVEQYTVHDGDVKYVMVTQSNYFGINRWIYGIPLSFIVYNEQTCKHYVVLIHHKYYDDIEKSQWVNSNHADIVPVQKKNKYYIVEISYNHMDLYFNDPNGEDIDYYVYCCIIFQKADCLRSVYNKYLHFIITNNGKNSMIKNGIINNPFQHYFLSTTGKHTNMSAYLRRLNHGAYSDKYSMMITKINDKLKVAKNMTFEKTYVACFIHDKLKKMCDTPEIIAEKKITRGETNLKHVPVELFGKEISSFFNNYESCTFNRAYKTCTEKLKTLSTEHATNMANFEKKMISGSNLDTVSFIRENSNLLYDIMTYNLFEKFIRDTSKYDEKTHCLELKRMYDFINPKVIYNGTRTIDIIVFEILFGAYIREEQCDIYKKIIREIESEHNYNVYQLLMGRGKTAVIMPLVTLYFLLHENKYKNIILVTPENLTKQTYKAFVKFFSCVFSTNKIIYHGGNEGHTIANDLLDTTCTDIDIKDGKYTVSLKNVIITSDNNIKKILLNTHNIDPHIHSEIIEVIKTKSLLIMDEFDTIYDPMKSKFNVPIGEKTLIKKGYLITTEIYTTFVKFIYYALAMINRETKNNIYICKELSKAELLHHLSFFTKSKMCPEDDKYVLNEVLKLATLKKRYNSVITDKKYSITNKSGNTFYKIKTYEKLFFVLVDVGSLLHNHRYGFPTPESHRESQFYAVPYEAAYVPSAGSNFADIDIIMITTALTYFYNNNFRVIDICKIIHSYKHDTVHMLRQLGYSDEIIFDNLRRIPYFDVFDLSIAQLDSIDTADTSAMEMITKKINEHPAISKKYALLNNYITTLIGEIGYYTSYKSCSAIDIISSTFSMYKCGFTGMVFLNLPDYLEEVKNEFTGIHKNDSDIGSVYFAILGGSGVGTGNKFFDVRQDHLLAKIIGELKDEYNALIDSGAFLLDYSTETVANQLLLKYPDKTIIYINKSNDKKMLSKGNIISEYNDEQYNTDEVFMYYDNSHIIGQDIKQPFKFKALVTVNTFNKLSDIAQACFRLRNLNYGHEIDFLVNKNMTKITTRIKLLEMLHAKEKNMVDGVIEQEKLKQNLAYIANMSRDDSEKYIAYMYSDYAEYKGLSVSDKQIDADYLNVDFHKHYIKNIYGYTKNYSSEGGCSLQKKYKFTIA